ncbi:MAG TPA: ABC transporter permease [Conexivisphaerales archaeon]|nr:ABC transporter permease [Conexivisphaerales archaeon]
MNVGDIALVLVVGLQQSIAVALASQGELITEKSGILNIGIEGVMLMSAFVAAFVNWRVEGSFGAWSPYVGILGGMLTGMVMNFLLAFMSTKLRVNQVIAGIGMNIFSGGATVLALILIFHVFDQTPPAFRVAPVFTIPGMPVVGNVSPLEIFMFILPVITYWFLYRTKLGLHIRATGENPKAADTAGLNVTKIRIVATVLGGAMIGMAGAYLSVDYSPNFVRGVTRGLGFIAMAAVISGGWKPQWALGMSILFGISQGLYIQFGGVAGYTYLLSVLPYLVTVAALTIAGARLRSPAALASPYIKE